MNHILSLSCVLGLMLVTVPHGVKAGQPARSELLQLAQNTQTNDDESRRKPSDEGKTPLPPAKYSITTEKPIQGAAGGMRHKPSPAPPEETPAVTADAAENAATGSNAALAPTPAPVAGQAVSATAAAGVSAAASAVPGKVNVKGDSAAPVATALPDTSRSGVPPDIQAQQQQSGVPPDIQAQQQQSSISPEIQEQLDRQKAAFEGESEYYMEEVSIMNVPTANLRTVKYVIDDKYRLKGMIYGEEQGYIRILTADEDGNFNETYKSPSFNSPIRGLFVEDLLGDKRTKIVAYTADGNFVIIDYETHEIIYRTPEGTYQNINCMVVHNMDTDPQMELFFIGVKPGTTDAGDGDPAGNLVQFDTSSQFEEWTSADLFTATDMVVGNVDTDPDEEIVLNTGEILSIRFKDIEWRSTIDFGTRLYLIDMDSDDILEVVTEYAESYVKIIDVDQRREKW